MLVWKPWRAESSKENSATWKGRKAKEVSDTRSRFLNRLKKATPLLSSLIFISVIFVVFFIKHIIDVQKFLVMILIKCLLSIFLDY